MLEKRLYGLGAVAMGAALLVASALSATPPALAGAKFDRRWAALQTCLASAEQRPLNHVEHPDGTVRLTSPGHLRVYAPDGFVARSRTKAPSARRSYRRDRRGSTPLTR
jgi:hypothetical protein